MDKATFMSKPKLAKLTLQQKEARWKQHLANKAKQKSMGGQSSPRPQKKQDRPQKGIRNRDPMSDCAKVYAQAAIDPWGVSKPPCVPDLVVTPSFKYSGRNRGTFQTGGSVAFAQFTPYNCSVNDSNCLWSSTSAYVATTINNSGTGVATTFSDSPFPTSTFVIPGSGTAAQTWRLVGAGLRVRYIGPEQYRSGRMVLYRAPGNTGIPNASTFADITRDRNAVTTVVDREWHTVVWKPTAPTDLSYFSSLGAAGSQVGRLSDASGCLIIAIDGCNSNCAFEYDFVAWYEAIGHTFTNVTPSHSDVLGMSAVESARGQINNSGGTETLVSTFAESAFGALADMSGLMLSPEMPIVMNAAKNFVKSTLSTSGNGLGSTLVGQW